MAATLQRKSSGGINFVIITKIITKENVPRNYFVIISARMVYVLKFGPNRKFKTGPIFHCFLQCL